MWDLIVSVPDHCLSFYFPNILQHILRQIQGLILTTLKVFSIFSFIKKNNPGKYILEDGFYHSNVSPSQFLNDCNSLAF